MTATPTHFNARGEAQMVDVGNKPLSHRRAIAQGRIVMSPKTLNIIRAGTASKGDVLAIARVAAIMAAKKTAELIPLCHPLMLNKVSVEFEFDADGQADLTADLDADSPANIACRVTTETSERTGVEMEALTAVQVALLTIYDMCKAVDRGMTITDVRLLHKSGGASGVWNSPDVMADSPDADTGEAAGDLQSCDFDAAAISVARAHEIINQTVSPITRTQTLKLKASLRRVLASDVVSKTRVPNHTNSAMDGYAFAADDLTADLTADRAADDLNKEGDLRAEFLVVGSALAGAPFCGEVKRGECVRIMTGAVMPAGTDTVIMQERVTVDEGDVDEAGVDDKAVDEGEIKVRFSGVATLKRGANVRYAGEDVEIGDVVLSRGTRVGASQLGVMASLGMIEVEVFRKPRIAYLSCGDELRSLAAQDKAAGIAADAAGALELGEVYDSNRYTLHAMLNDLTVEEIDLGVVADDRAAIAAAIDEATHKRADLIITTAGASVGEADYMKEILGHKGEIKIEKVAIKPGRPLSFGKLTLGEGKRNNAVFFGLPGNPVSVMVTFQIFLKSAIKRLSGEIGGENGGEIGGATVLKMRTTTAVVKRAGRMEYQRGVMSRNAQGENVVSSTGEQGSGILSSMCRANCFIILAEDSVGVAAGEWVSVQPFAAGG